MLEKANMQYSLYYAISINIRLYALTLLWTSNTAAVLIITLVKITSPKILPSNPINNHSNSR